jgi:hypothetical protein
MKRRTLWIIGILLLSLALVACKGTPHKRGVSSVTVSIDTAKSAAGYQAPGKSMAPVVVQTLKFTISASDMETITRTVTVSPTTMVTESFDVPNGDGRVLMVEAIDPASAVVYQGGTVFDLTGGPKELTVVMQAMFFDKLIWTLEEEKGTALAKDGSGNIIIAGHSLGNLDGNTNAGPDPAVPSVKTPDVFVTKITPAGGTAWTVLIGTPGSDIASGVAVDPSDDSIVVIGTTVGGRNGNPNEGETDCFITKLTATGAVSWTTVLGSAGIDRGGAVVVGQAGNVYITGYTYGQLDTGGTGTSPFADIFVSKLSSTGLTMWTDQISASNSSSFGTGIAVDASGNVYVTGYTNGSLPGAVNANQGISSDLFLMKLDASTGAQIGVYQLGTPDIDQAWSVAVDGAGMAYVAGGTYGDLDGNTNANRGTADIFVTRFSTTLPVASWVQPGGTMQAGSTANDIAYAVTLDATNNALYLTGGTIDNLPGNITAGLEDLFVMKIDLASPTTPAWTRQMGSSFEDEGRSIIVDGAGDVLAAGTTRGGFTIPLSYDAFLVIYDSLGNKK